MEQSFGKIEKDRVYTDLQAGQILNKSVTTLARWRIQGSGPRFVKIGRSVGYRGAAILAYIEDSERQSTAQVGS